MQVGSIICRTLVNQNGEVGELFHLSGFLCPVCANSNQNITKHYVIKPRIHHTSNNMYCYYKTFKMHHFTERSDTSITLIAIQNSNKCYCCVCAHGRVSVAFCLHSDNTTTGHIIHFVLVRTTIYHEIVILLDEQ